MQARGQGPVRVNTNDFRFNRGGTMQRGGQSFVVDPSIGPGGKMHPAQPYGMAPEEYVAPAPKRNQATQAVPAYPILPRARAAGTAVVLP